MVLLQRFFLGMSLVFILGIFPAYAAVDYFPTPVGAWWKYDYTQVTQHGRGGKELSGTATWTVNSISGNTIYIDLEISYTQEYTYDRNKSTGAISNEVTKEIDPPQIITEEVELEDDGNWIVADKLGEDGCDGLTPWGNDVISFVHDPDEPEPNPSYLFDVEKISGNERDSVKVHSRTTDNPSQYNKNNSWTIEATSIEGVGPQSIWRGLGKASRNPIEHQCMDIYELIEYDLGTPIKGSSSQNNNLKRHFNVQVNDNTINIMVSPEWSGKNYSLELINASGKQVLNTKNNLTGKTVLETENLSMGIYYLRLKHSGETFLTKIPIMR